jgi:hypothetical protein
MLRCQLRSGHQNLTSHAADTAGLDPDQISFTHARDPIPGSYQRPRAHFPP